MTRATEKLCGHCSKPLVRNVGEASRNFTQRKVCNFVCFLRKRGLQPSAAALEASGHTGHTGRDCLHCKKPLVQEEGESYSGAFRRKFCDLKCYTKARAK